ncbi:ketopantoate reductase family protein [Nocardia sp. BMG51109]|uniref:ketopantoate reductase family protein n=1 Tax=Nocardia sp. BMG51109 TaxID=1056816 RepID=UPI0004665E47|nr:2-dehydropantoate 2-reductase N-terminal domain-containing protein [Nocardia sp. BMG51109]
MDVLIVGAGALGQVYGAELARGAATVSYLVKPGRADGVRDGARVARLRRLREPAAMSLTPARVYTDPGAVADTDWHSVWLFVDSTALQGAWLRPLRRAVGGSTVVSLDQSLGDRPALTAVWPAEQLVSLTVPDLAWAAPLGAPDPDHTAYYRPPGGAAVLAGSPERVAPVRALLRNAGVAARTGRVGNGVAYAARTVPYVASLEVADWSLAALRADTTPASRAAVEAATVVAAEHGLRAPYRRVLDRQMRVMLRMLPALAPFDTESFLRAHFTKVGPQTRAMLRDWADLGEQRGLAVTHLRSLEASMPPLPAGRERPGTL